MDPEVQNFHLGSVCKRGNNESKSASKLMLTVWFNTVALLIVADFAHCVRCVLFVFTMKIHRMWRIAHCAMSSMWMSPWLCHSFRTSLDPQLVRHSCRELKRWRATFISVSVWWPWEQTTVSICYISMINIHITNKLRRLREEVRFGMSEWERRTQQLLL